MTKGQLENRYRKYKNSNYYTLDDLYKNYSNNKRKAESNIKYIMSKIEGAVLNSYKVIGGNSSHFTAGWLKEQNGKTIFVFETHCNTYEIEV